MAKKKTSARKPNPNALPTRKHARNQARLQAELTNETQARGWRAGRMGDGE